MRGEQPWRTNRSRVLRSRPISAEAKLWAYLRNRQLGGHKLVRQVPIGPYFADFVCRERKVIIEVDGGTHSTDREIADDAKRTSDLQALASSASATTQHRLRARRSAGLHRGRALTGRGPWLSDRVDP
jgi:very-short-patch-repair endonuclease